MDEFNDDDIEQVAIIGMAGRFPGAGNIEQFWLNLRDGKESITPFSDVELLARGVTAAELSHPDYVKSGTVLDGVDLFDADFFGYTAKEAEIMDPQQRFFLEISWEALEDAGCDPKIYDGSIGVFAGAGGNDYKRCVDSEQKNITAGLDSFQTMLGNDSDYLATRVSYKLNLTGPSFTLQTACSTSLVAVHTACQYLLTYQCDVALAGGVSIRLPQGVGYQYRDGMIWSPDGHCRAFDAKGQGMFLGHGAAAVVLKRLSEALADGDHIYAVIKGSAINNDGSLKVGFTAPSVEGQAAVISIAQSVAGVSPESISYVEAHGTGTQLGDPVEVEALTKAFRLGTERVNFCALGSVKTNIGHLDAAAGVAGLIKTALSLKHREIPASLHYTEPNPNIDFKNSPFYVNAELTDWLSAGEPRRAGVSSFGIGGTNAHVVLEEAPVQPEAERLRPWQLLLLSAKSEEGVTKVAARLASYLKDRPEVNLADVAYTLQTGRQHFDYRLSVVCKDVQHAVESLMSQDVHAVCLSEANSDVVFMFSGQGSQYIDMGEGLYRSEPLFREQVDYCADVLHPLLGLDLREILFPVAEKKKEAKELINQTRITQPALFVIEYCLAKLLASWRVHPRAMVGHSIGEYVAACLAGVFSLEDALSIVAKRGALMQACDSGSMLAVPLSEKEISDLLPPDLSVAVINAPTMTVVSGEKDAINAFKVRMDEKHGLDCRVLHTSHAFHSHMMEPIVEEFQQIVSSFTLGEPQVPFVSNISGDWITPEQATSPEYWASHLRQPVRFFSCLTTLFSQKGQVLIEVGPGQVLTFLSQQHPDIESAQVISMTRRPVERKDDRSVLLAMVGKLWAAGVGVDWQNLHSLQTPHKVSLPSYPFARKHFWLERVDAIVSPSGTDQEHLPGVAISESDVVQGVSQVLVQLTGVVASELNETISFSEFGFDSLLLTQIASVLTEKFGVPVRFRQLNNEAPTIKALAAYIEKRLTVEKGEAVSVADGEIWQANGVKNLIAIQPKGSKVPFILVHGDNANNFLPQWLDKDQPLYGYLHQGVDGEEIRYKTVEDIASHYLRELDIVLPDGPYNLGGFSFGGLVAYEMACRLIQQGKDVQKLLLLDAYHPNYLREYNDIKKYRNLVRFPVRFCRDIWRRVICSQRYLLRGLAVPSQFRNRYILATYIKAALMYDPPQVSCPVSLFRAIDEICTEPSNGWSGKVGGDLHVDDIPGNHLSMIRSPENSQVLAAAIMARINVEKQ